MQNPDDFFSAHRDVHTVEAFVVDVNGVLRGKSMPARSAVKIFNGGLRLPFSAFAVDIWGTDVPAAGLVASGDGDGICHAAPGGLSIAPWSDGKTAQIMMSMSDSAGRPFHSDPRHVLAKVLDLFKKRGWTPVVAAELEFYLIDPGRGEYGQPLPPLSAGTGRRAKDAQNYGIGEMRGFAPVLEDINQYCRDLEIPADATVSEAGPGQFEINLLHVPDALLAADHATMFKRIVKAAAQKHSLDATFMAKPYGDSAGSGMHIHFSVLDADGKNIFAGENPEGSAALRYAVGGLLENMKDSTAIFAPNYNSYRRFKKGSHAPTAIAWGYDNRSSALRIPESEIAATRIELRVPGADANPYLAMAVMLAAAYDGLADKTAAPAPLCGNIYESNAERLPASWDAALVLFEDSSFIDKYFDADFKKIYLACKRQEKEEIESRVSSIEHDAYLRDL